MSIENRTPARGGPPRTGAAGVGLCGTGASALAVLIALWHGSAMSGCQFLSPACTPSVEPGVAVVLSDEQGVAIEGATLTLTSGAFTEVMQESGEGRYTGADERSGTYALMIEADGFAPRSVEDIQVAAGRCHVETANLELTLAAAENGS